MSTGVFLSYKGLGANLLHLSYCHEIAKRYGPIEIITLSKNLEQALEKDPLIKKITYLNQYHKKIIDIYKLAKLLKKYNFKNLFIFYPSFRFFISAKIAGIENIYTYPLFKKRKLHLVKAAKQFIEKNLNIINCPTESKIFIDDNKIKIAKTFLRKNRKNIIIGAGSSGSTTKWGSSNYIKLITELKKKLDCFFFVLCGPEDKDIADNIVKNTGSEISFSISDWNIKEIVPLISLSSLYIGNDSFGHHVACQTLVPSIILLLDTPSAYSDYSINQYQILPEEININDIDHNSKISPDKIKVEFVLKKSLELLR